MKVSTVEIEKVIKQEQQVTITRSELSEILKKTAAKVITELNVPGKVGLGLALTCAAICADVEKAIFEKEDK